MFELGSNTLVSWEVDMTSVSEDILQGNALSLADVQGISFRVVFHKDATLVSAGPPATMGLLSTAHLKRVEALTGAQEETVRRQVETVVFKVLQAVRQTVDNAVESMIQSGVDSSNFFNTPFQGSTPLDADSRTTLRTFFPVVQNQCYNAPLAQRLIEDFSQPEAGRSSKRARVAEIALMPAARLAHTMVDVDPDKIPRYERDLHYADHNGRADELLKVIQLFLKALASQVAADHWNRIVFGNSDHYGVDEFEAMVISNNPFPSRSDAGKISQEIFNFDIIVTSGSNQTLSSLIYNRIMKAVDDEILLVGAPDAAVMHDAPVLVMGETSSEYGYAIGTAAYPFIEALSLASAALVFASTERDAEYVRNGDKRQDNSPYRIQEIYDAPQPLATTGSVWEKTDMSLLTNEVSLYRITFESILRYLEEYFRGWHHARCLEPRQTAHAVVVRNLARQATDHFAENGSVQKLTDSQMADVDLLKSQNYLKALGTIFAGTQTEFDSKDCKEALFRYWTVLDMLSDVDTPRLVYHPTCYVQGPGNAAVPTVCEALAWWTPSSMLQAHADELLNMMPLAINDLPQAQRAPNTVAAKVLAKNPTNLYQLCKCAAPVHLARVLRELNVYASVRADGGKRYRHLLGVNASIAALNSAVRHLLLSRAVNENP